jgi:hypothetical protein
VNIIVVNSAIFSTAWKKSSTVVASG